MSDGTFLSGFSEYLEREFGDGVDSPKAPDLHAPAKAPASIKWDDEPEPELPPPPEPKKPPAVVSSLAQSIANVNEMIQVHKPAAEIEAPSLDAMSDDQKAAVEAITSRPGPFFLTGPAGSGKSYVINYLRNAIPDTVVCATTGMAAQIIHGRTIHSFAVIIPRKGVINSSAADRRMRECELLIIDEASMMNTLLLNQIYERIERSNANPTICLVGDLFQLPPVEGDMITDAPIFESFEIMRLSTQHRQHEGLFIDVLGDLRKGKRSERLVEFIAGRTFSELPDDVTHLMSHKRKVGIRNMQKLNELPGEGVEFEWRKEIVDDPYDKADYRRARFPDFLEVKVGARVVLLNNHSGGMWVNGSTGEITEIRDNAVDVRLDRGGYVVAVGRHKEELLDGSGKVLATVEQLPLQLAWALTIHKSQGMTLDRVGVDLRNHFASGMTYVALSRCRTAEGLYLTGKLGSISVDPRVIKFAKKLKARG